MTSTNERTPLIDSSKGDVAARHSQYAPPPPPQPTPLSTAVLVRVDGSGVCIDGQEHAWKNRYPKKLWVLACVCLPCCVGPLYCYTHPQRECTKCGVVIQSRS